ncbi:CBM35 domain-containing protein [Metabacillus sp. Hm71]|uniref:CBM35 domain-containing protein n=1 Tax=Metabacillus sp. Hm71 TaxID=3450743 RepID=UPI003F41B7F1
MSIRLKRSISNYRGKKKSLISRVRAFSVLSTLALATAITGTASAQDSQFTRQGAGPMYFMTYEHQWTKNTYMPEKRLKENIDWMAKHFLPYGYNMVSTDGWIEGATLLNINGYVVSHNDRWMTNPLNMDGSEEEVTPGQLENGDFEEGSANGWQVETDAMFGVDANDAYEGVKLWVYDPKPHTAKVSQTVKGLENGNYTLTARVKFPNDVHNFIGGTSTANMKLKNYADATDGETAPEQIVKLNNGLTDEYGKARYGLFELQSEVTNGQLTVEFYIDAKGEHSSFQLDNVELYKTGEKPEEDSNENEPFQYPSEKYPDGHTWKFWGDYLKEKGMEFGIYYNPLWISPEVVKNPDKYIVKGTENNPDGPTYVVDLIDQGDPNDPTDGDRFNGGQGNERALYWVDVNHPDAEKYVKGYIDFFAEQGANFLRVDFLSWYETGTDANIGTVGQAHDRGLYEKSLKWMSEASKENNVFLSLVMPHLKNHGELEHKYGDMIRINEDTFTGGWEHISGRRQEWRPGWSQWANSFQGFTGFSDIGGRSSLILDGDFLRLNTFSGPYAENEKKTTLSLYTLAGSPIAISDQYDTIGANYPYYQNTELIEFNKMGLVGKPIYESAVHYGESNDSRDSERWAGQLPDGTWVIGLFNRQNESKAFDFNFQKELGIEKGHVRDVWSHQDLGIQSSYSVTLEAHDSVVLKVVPATAEKVFEAEVAAYSKGVEFSNTLERHAGFGYLNGFNESDESITYAINAPSKGVYNLNLKYDADENSEATVHVREDKSGKNTLSKQVSFEATNDQWKEATVEVELDEGTNLVKIDYASGNFNLDSITLGEARNQEIASSLRNSDFEDGFAQWSRSNMVNQSIVDGAVQIAGADAFTSDLWQYVVPKAGIYKLTAEVKRSGQFDEAAIYMENGKCKQAAEIQETDDMTTVTISNIEVSEGDILKIGNIANTQAGGKLTIENIQLSPAYHNHYFKVDQKNINKTEIVRDLNVQNNTKLSSYLLKLTDQTKPKSIQASIIYKAVNSIDEMKEDKETYFFNEKEGILYLNIPANEMKKLQIKY